MHEVSCNHGPHIACQFLLQVLASFLMETYFMHWAHGIEEIDALDVVGYYYLFNSLAVRIQYNQRGYLLALKQSLKSAYH